MSSTHLWHEADGTLNRRFVIYLPSCRKDGSAIEGYQDLADAAARLLCELFGGVTSYPATGLFRRSTGEAQKEQVVALETFCESADWERRSNFLHRTAAMLAELLDQESIACSLDGRLSFVEPKEDPGAESSDGKNSASAFSRWLSGERGKDSMGK